jgi:DNA-binding response OmpR family regulator
MRCCRYRGVIGLRLEALAFMEPNLPTLVIVEDHAVTRRFLADNLAADGYEPIEAETAAAGRRAIAERFPAAAIIDLGLPDRDGLELLRELRDYGRSGGPLDPQLPVVIVSGRATELDRLRGFERGCDDYLTKPFSYVELRARLAAVLRRAGARPRPGRIRIGPLDVDPFSRQVRLDGTLVHLSKKEFGLLVALATEPARVFTRAELLDEVWGFQSPVPTRTLDAHASRLRQKLSVSGGRFIVNVWGVGYRLMDGELGR